MATSYLVLVARARLPTARAWNEALRARGFAMTLDADLDLATHDGFVSCLLGTQHSGFEVHCEDEEEADLDVGLLGHMTGRDAVVTFAARGDVQNVAALLASALLVQLTAGLLVPADTGDPFDASEALAIAREAYDELAGMAAPRAAPARIRIPFAALGYPAEAPALVRFALELAGDEDVVHLLGGIVSNAGTIAHTEAGMPTSAIEGGLFDEAIFGPLARTVDGALSLPANAALHPLDAPQGRAFGRIELPAPFPLSLGRALPSRAAALRSRVDDARRFAACSATDRLHGRRAPLLGPHHAVRAADGWLRDGSAPRRARRTT